MQIDNVLTISTAHLMPTTREAMHACSVNEPVNPDLDWLPVYSKSFCGEEFGWFAYIIDMDRSQINNLQKKYPDLYDCIRYAQNHNCNLICFDRDVDTTSDLPIYEEEDEAS
jgi:hypothetical protein